MRNKHIFPVVMLMGIAAFSVVTQTQATMKGEKPDDSPGWVVVEEDWFFPLMYDSSETFHQARAHFRRNEETAAANELTRAGSWLRYAASHARPETKKSLQKAAEDLTALAEDLKKGELHSARTLDVAIAQASHALSEWHYYKAKDQLGQQDAKRAAQHLRAAAHYLRTAADSANFEYGSDVVAVYDSIDRYGMNEEFVVEPNVVSKDLSAVEHELERVADKLKTVSK